MIQELSLDHIHRPSSPNLSHLDTQSLASTTGTTLYHVESADDADLHVDLKCKSCKISSDDQELDNAKPPSQSPFNHSVLRLIVSSRTISILDPAGSSISQVKTASPFSTP